MKWTDKKVKALRELCEKDTPNKDIATILQCKVSDVYAKRSQLGITIDKVKAAQQQTTKKSNQQPSSLTAVKEAFDNLHIALVAAAKSDRTSNAGIYADTDTLILGVRDIFLRSFKK